MHATGPLPDFAVIDTETTGLSPERGDRMLELAVIRMRADGSPVARYETLLNPGRPVGATHIHGITAADLRDAPRFADVAADVLAQLADCVLVAHNAAFDFGFLAAECRRAGLSPGDPLRFCTVIAARRFCPGLFNHKLANVCRCLGIALEGAHSAMGDCTATAAVLQCFLPRMELAAPADLKVYGAEGRHLFPQMAIPHPPRPAVTREMARRPPPDRQLTLPL